MPGVGVIFNPNAKRYKKNPEKLKRMAFIIGEKASGKPTSDLEDLHVVADEFKSKDIDILAISGGDGTIHCTLTAFLKVYGEKPLPKIALLRGGTQNNVANSYDIKGDTEHLLSNLLLKYHESPDALKEKELLLLKVNDLYGTVFGMGAGYNFMKFYYSYPNLNKAIAFWSAIRVGLSGLYHGKLIHKIFERVDAEIEVDGKPWGFANTNAIVAATVPMPGINFRIFHRMFEQNDRFHLLTTSLPPRQLLPLLPALGSGKQPKTENIADSLANHVKMKFEKPMGFTVDGDMLGPATEITLSKGPKITLLV